MEKWTENPVVRGVLDVILGLVGIAMCWLIGLLWSMTTQQQETAALITKMQSDQQALSEQVSMNTENQRLVTIATMVRTDPWSGRMTTALCDEWANRLNDAGVHVEGYWMDVVMQIQKEFSEDLIPEQIKELLK